jgi:hypothetical protein
MPYYPEQTHFAPLATILRDRTLSVPGEVVVKRGSTVVAADVVARAAASSRRVILDVAEELGISADMVESSLMVGVGDAVEEGQPLARRRGFLTSAVLRAPVGGIVVLIEGGRMILEAEPEAIELRAIVPGTVTTVMPGRGVQIRTVGALIEGVWGSGGVEAGAMRVVGREAGGELPGAAITMGEGGAVLVTHVPLSDEALEAAGEHRVRGIIAPSMRASLIPKAKVLESTSIVLTEGFGRSMMTEAIYNLLRDHEGREAVLIATAPERWSARRPEVIIPLSSPGQLPPVPHTGEPLGVGSRVRLLRDPYTGLVGTVTVLPEAPRSVESGLTARGACVDLGKGREAFVPLANLELLG